MIDDISKPTGENSIASTAILILAAGASRRMGGTDKLVQKVDNKPLLGNIASKALATGQPVYVALPMANHARLTALAGLPVIQFEVERAEFGMAESMAVGVGMMPNSIDSVMVVLADMPDLTTADFRTMLDAYSENPDRVCRAANNDGTPGHPVIFPRRMFAELMQLKGDHGARALLTDEKVVPVSLPDSHATVDLDTPEEWLAWRKANPFRN